MPSVEQKYPGYSISLGDLGQSSIESEYVIRDAIDEAVAWNALDAATVGSSEITVFSEKLVRGPVEITDRLGNATWEGRVSWRSRQSQQQLIDQAATEGGFHWNFETTGGTQHITQSLATVRYGVRGGNTAPDFHGAIGVSAADKDPEGVDIVVPALKWSETHKFPAATIPFSYAQKLYYLTGRVNIGPFRGFAPGEVLFEGATGGKQSANSVEMTYKFSASPNVLDVAIGDITNITKPGWAYLWVRYATDTDDAAGELVKVPSAVYVEKVYRDADFALLGIGA